MGARIRGSSHMLVAIAEDWTCLWADLASILKVSVPYSVTMSKAKA